MRLVLIGGGGFVGKALCRRVLQRGHLTGSPVRSVVVYDAMDGDFMQLHELATAAGSSLDVHIGSDLPADAAGLVASTDDEPCAVYHLASIMSGQSEEDPDLAWSTNVMGLRAVLEACRAQSRPPRLVFSSSAAVFGPEASVGDSTKQVPHSTYGMTKAMCELLVNDYSRRGYVDGCSARLPTIVVRPGKPNAATTSAFSGVVREPLNGDTAVLNVDPEFKHPVCGHRTLVECLVSLGEVDVSPLGVDRAVNLPAMQASLRELYGAAQRYAEAHGISIGGTVVDIDERINGIVTSFCSDIDASRAVGLGLPQDSSLDDLVTAYAEDFLSSSSATGGGGGAGAGVGAPVAAVGTGDGGASDVAGGDKPVVGYVGLGNMGAGMVANLSAAGYPVVLYNRTASKATQLAAALPGPATVADSPADVARQAAVVLSCLANEAATETMFFGDDGVFAGVRSRAAGTAPVSVVDHATVSPSLSLRCAAQARAVGAAFIDAPISGGPEGAAAGTLSIMCGGDEAVFLSVQPVLCAMGSHVVHMGSTPAGTAAKLVNQALVGVHAHAAAEALRFGTELGIRDLSQLVELLCKSWGHSRVLARVGPIIASAVTLGGGDAPYADSGAPLRNLSKDLALIMAAADGDEHAARLAMPHTALAADLYAKLTSEGKGAHDMAVAYLSGK